MPYHINIPKSTDDPKDSQQDLLDNFGKLNSDFTINHQPFTTTSNPGFHTKIQFPGGLSVNPNLAFPQSSLYTKLVSGAIELFFQNGANSSDVRQLTNLPVTTGAVNGTNYTIETPWGLKLQMGEATASPITFASAFTGTPTFLTALATNVNGTSVRVTGLFNSTANYTAVGGNTIRYLIIGKE